VVENFTDADGLAKSIEGNKHPPRIRTKIIPAILLDIGVPLIDLII
jgi:hypothetical protein